MIQTGPEVDYSPTRGGWVWDAKRFSLEDLPPPDLQSGIEEQVTRVTDVPALSAAKFRQIFRRWRRGSENTTNRAELSRLVRDDCVARASRSPGQP